MAETIDEITVNYSDENGTELVKEVDKVILTRGSWTTIMFLLREWEPKSQEWSPLRVRIERYQKRQGLFRSQSRFKISGSKQARQIIATLDQWFPAGSAEQDE